MRVLIVDTNNLVARMAYVFKEAQRPDGFPIGGLYGAVKMLRSILADMPHDAVLAAVDYGVPAFRRKVCPEYKAQREKDLSPEDEEQRKRYKQQVGVIHEVLKPLGITTARAKEWEGDDVIAALAQHRLKDHRCTIYSSDRDFNQLVTDDGRIRFYDAHNNVFKDRDPHYVLKRCLDPKESDNLDGVPGIGPKKADILVDAWAASGAPTAETPGYVDAFIDWCAAQPQTRLNSKKEVVATLHGAVIAEQQKVRANWKCTFLSATSAACAEDLKFRRNTPDRAEFLAVCRQYKLAPLIEDMSAIWPTFVDLKQVV